MPPQTEKTPETSGRTMSIWVGILVVLLGVGAIFYWWQELQQSNIEAYVGEAITDARAGDLMAAQLNAMRVTDEPASTADQRALAALATAGNDYRMTGSADYLLKHIPIFKTVIEDQGVSLPIRARAINMLASAYCGSGRTPAVYEEIYEGEQYSQFKSEGDPDRSSRNMFEWSYGLYPTSDAGIFLARAYASQAYNAHMRGATSTVGEDIEKAKGYLASAEELARSEAVNNTDYTSSQRYAAFKYWRVYTIAILAHLEGGTYKDIYRAEYESFITTFPDSFIKYNYLSYARMLFAYFLVLIDNDEEAARAQLAAIEPFVKTDPYYDTDQFVRFVHNEREMRARGIKQGPFTDAMVSGVATSPEFAAFTASIP